MLSHCLRQAGHTLLEIAVLTGVGKRSVQRVSTEPMITELRLGSAAGARPTGRPSKAAAYRPQVNEWLTEDPRCSAWSSCGGRRSHAHWWRTSRRRGGIPLLAVFDRPKTVALTWRKNGDVTEWSPIFAGVVLDLGLGIEVCWPYAPNKKGRSKIWSAGSKVVSSKQRRFLDDEDLRTQLAAWLLEVSATRPSRATGVIPAVRLVADRARLHPLKVALSSSLITRGESSHTMLAGGDHAWKRERTP